MASSSDATSSDTEPVEYLATARARRSTAGNHMSTLLDAEADDELALLFAEDEEDEEFTFGEEEGEGDGAAAVEYADDMELDSSSDEEDRGPDSKEGELEGEEELEKQARAERLAKKRKAHESLRLTALRKKVKIDPNLPSRPLTAAAPRQRKKSERISWLPTPEDGPTRSSSRMQTVRNKELTHARLKDSEQRRIRLIATMERAAQRKENMKSKQMTQADRLAEAAKTERVNRKTLNRWEEMEKKRTEEQQARLEALQNRRLEGPVVTWWSGIAKWINDRLAQVGIKTYAQVAEREPVKRKKNKDAAAQEPTKCIPAKTSDQQEHISTVQAAQPEGGASGTAAQQGLSTRTPKDQVQKPLDDGISFLDGIHLYASMNDETISTDHPPNIQQPKELEREGQQAHTTAEQATDVLQPPGTATLATSENVQDTRAEEPTIQTPLKQPTLTTGSTTDVKSPTQSATLPGSSTETSGPQPPPNTELSQPLKADTSLLVPSPQQPPKIETSSRNCIILEDFDSTTPQERSEYSILFNPRKPQKLQKPTQEICPITGRSARYRDPQTGVSYANAQAYREIRQVLAGRYAWSGFLGCFVGELGGGARGVPERFLAPNVPPPREILVPPAPVKVEGGPGSDGPPDKPPVSVGSTQGGEGGGSSE
ncbi:predicted protein [Uncinocarpus reesii 1704]|uniref:Vps72/YL1 C-terminal domain-containing protein n=1 Tax=Uncinocarpus reesii (strain UAMH 1704) TaxID=336963 RepID=C4JEC6_UNCRE|nr:uncharacterized protein UREG_00742 [Uncinocarpus reesii 1704]EEP75895.1 predicted protein [Uncinocarpus reesii 1704]